MSAAQRLLAEGSPSRFFTAAVVTYVRTLTIGGRITVQLTSCLFCLDSAALLMLTEQQFYLFGLVQTS